MHAIAGRWVICSPASELTQLLIQFLLLLNVFDNTVMYPTFSSPGFESADLVQTTVLV